MRCLRLKSHSADQTRLLGDCLGKLAQRSDIFLLVGELGTGKTCLVQGIARGLNIKEFAFSPSFVIVREYHGRLPLYHVDFYRLDRAEEIVELGLEDYFWGDGVCVVEWADKGIQVVPKDHLLVTIQYIPGSEASRSIRIEPRGSRYRKLVERLGAAKAISVLSMQC